MDDEREQASAELGFMFEAGEDDGEDDDADDDDGDGEDDNYGDSEKVNLTALQRS